MNTPQAFGALIPLIANTWGLSVVVLQNKVLHLGTNKNTIPNYSKELVEYLYFARLYLQAQTALRDQLETCIRTGLTSRNGLFAKVDEVLNRGSFMFSDTQKASLKQDEQESVRLFQSAHDEALEALKKLDDLIEEVSVCIKKAEALQ